MRAPRFWSNPPERPGLAARLLWPAAALIGRGPALRRALAPAPRRCGVPVICVGNLVAGGAGKTPTAIALAEALAASGVAASFVTRGYGGRLRGPHRVDAMRDGAGDVGDEALLLAARAPTFLARDRAAGAAAAEATGAEAILLDDGHQNPALVKDLSVVVVDAGAGFGNGRTLPAGPLREPVAAGLARAGAVALIGGEEDAARTLARWPALRERPLLRARIAPVRTGQRLDDAPLLAFAGIGRPEKFFDTLREEGATLAATRAFPDHCVYDARALSRLAAEARALGAELVTTEKDMVRLPPAFRAQVRPVMIRLVWADETALEAVLRSIVARAAAAKSP